MYVTDMVGHGIGVHVFQGTVAVLVGTAVFVDVGKGVLVTVGIGVHV